MTYFGRDFRRSTACRQREWTGNPNLELSVPPRCSPELFYPWKSNRTHKNDKLNHTGTVLNKQMNNTLKERTLRRRPWVWSRACVWSWRSCSLSWFPGWLEAGGVWRWRTGRAEAGYSHHCCTADGSDRGGTWDAPEYSTPERKAHTDFISTWQIKWKEKAEFLSPLCLFYLWEYCIELPQQTSECCFFSPRRAPLVLFILQANVESNTTSVHCQHTGFTGVSYWRPWPVVTWLTVHYLKTQFKWLGLGLEEILSKKRKSWGSTVIWLAVSSYTAIMFGWQFVWTYNREHLLCLNSSWPLMLHCDLQTTLAHKLILILIPYDLIYASPSSQTFHDRWCLAYHWICCAQSCRHVLECLLPR